MEPLNPVQVELVATSTGLSRRLVSWILLLPLRAWLVMLLLPVATDWHLSYWQALAAVVLAWLMLIGRGLSARFLDKDGN